MSTAPEADAPQSFILLDDFTEVIQQMMGMPVWAVWMKSYELCIGKKHIIPITALTEPCFDNEKPLQVEVPDFSLCLGENWTIVKQGRLISKHDEKSFSGVWAWLGKIPDISSLSQAQIADVVVGAKAKLVLRFADGQVLTIEDYWCLDELASRIRYEPTTDGRVTATALPVNQDILTYLKKA